MDQRALGELAEQAAALAERGDPGALSELVQEAAKRYGLPPWTVTGWIAREWDRLGIRRVPRGTVLPRTLN